MVSQTNCRVSTGDRVRYTGRARNLQVNREGVVVKGKINSRTPLVKFGDISVYVSKGNLEVMRDVVIDPPNDEASTQSKTERKEKLDNWKKKDNERNIGRPNRYDLILNNRKLIKDNRLKRANKRDELRRNMKLRISGTECDKELNKLDTEILKLKDDIKNFPAKEVEDRIMIRELYDRVRDLRKETSRTKFLYANGHYAENAHSPSTYLDLCLGRRVHFIPGHRDVEL